MRLLSSQMVDDSTKAAADAEATFKTEVEKLQNAYVALSRVSVYSLYRTAHF